jgi:bifunctional non-homologous end joining protein LigD
MPVHWKQVRAELDPKSFTVRTAPTLLAKTKPWGDYDQAASSLKDAVKRLVTAGKAKA